LDAEHARAGNVAMKWRLTFYNERSSVLACYDVESRLAEEAGRLAWQALLAEHPETPRVGRPSLFERAERAGGQHPSRWVLYRCAQTSQRRLPRMTPAEAAAGEISAA
jgi:hypothetical protein